jgi:uncharacterized protein YndB with AHSA1/START domain
MAQSEVEVDAKQGGVQVVRTVDAPVAQVWETLISRTGAQALLGSGATLGGKGEPWHSDDGPSGVLRSYHPLEQLRLSWHRTPQAPASVVEIDLAEDAGATRIDLRHDRVDGDPAEHEQRWAEALDRLDRAVRG